MKIVTLLLFLGLLAVCSKPAERPREMYVQAAGGLNMRSQPDPAADKILLLPDGAALRILQEDSRTIEISGKSGRWTQVEYNGKTGWVFGGFLASERNSAGDPEICPLAGKTLDGFRAGCFGKSCKGSCGDRTDLNRDGTAWIDTHCEGGEKGTWTLQGNSIRAQSKSTVMNVFEHECGLRGGEHERTCREKYSAFSGYTIVEYTFALQPDGTILYSGTRRSTGDFPPDWKPDPDGSIPAKNKGCLYP